jgi:MinD-like ATPase involved in chromosome partitioning or flagellar assembly
VRQAGDAVAPPPPARGRVVTVWGPVGAPGRTTIAVTLAAELAARGRTSLLVDADTYGASVAQTLGLLDESAGLIAATRAANQGTLDAARLAGLAPEVIPRLRVLTGLPQPRRWSELRPSALEVVWDQARGLAACTVVDTGFGLDADEELMFDTSAPRRNGAALSALTGADLVIAVGSGDPIGLQRLLAGLPELREVTGTHVPVQVVVTKVRDQAIGGAAADRVRGALARYAGIDDAVLIPDDRSALDAAMLVGRTLTESAPSSPARLAIAALADQLLGPGQPLDDGSDPASSGPLRRSGARPSGGRIRSRRRIRFRQ